MLSKNKVVPVQTMKAYVGGGGTAVSILTTAVHGGE